MEEGAKEKTSRKSNKILKWIGIIIMTPVLLVLLLFLLIYFPPFQNFVVQKVADYASEQTGMEISVGHVNLSFPLDLAVNEVKVIRPNDSIPQKRDTVADVEKIIVDVQLLPLLKKSVQIDALDIRNAKLNTVDFIAAAGVKGRVGQLSLKSHGIDLSASEVKVDELLLKDADVDIALADSVPEDTTDSKTIWKIAADKLTIENTNATLHTAQNKMTVGAYFGTFEAKGGTFDLYTGQYNVAEAEWKNGKASYDDNDAIYVNGLDYNHIALSDVNIAIDSFSYLSPNIRAKIRECNLKEKSGLKVEELSGLVAIDSSKVYVENLHLKTPDTNIDGDVDMDFTTFDSGSDAHPGKMNANLNASVGKQDLMLFMNTLPEDMKRNWPSSPLEIHGQVKGNLQEAEFSDLRVNIPTALNLKADGYVKNLNNLDNLDADVKINGKTGDLNFITSLLDKNIRNNYRIPKGMTIDGRLKAKKKLYDADVKITEGKGNLTLKGKYDSNVDSYDATLDVNNINLHDFMPHDTMYNLSAKADIRGRGIDLMSKSTKLQAKAYIENFKYGCYDIDNVHLDADLANGVANADIKSDNKLLSGNIKVKSNIDKKGIDATISADLDNADLYRLRLSDDKVKFALKGDLKVQTDMKEAYKIKGTLNDIVIYRDSTITYRPGAVDLDILTRRDTTHAYASVGDFVVNMNTRGGYKHLLNQFNLINGQIKSDLEAKVINEKVIRKMLPLAEIHLSSGRDNPIYHYINKMGYDFDTIFVDLTSAPIEGLNGTIRVGDLDLGSVKLDSVNLSIISDTSNVKLDGYIRNENENEQFVLDTYLNGYLLPSGFGMTVKSYDQQKEMILNLGADAVMTQNGISLHLLPESPTIGYKVFELNKDNHISFDRNKRVSALVDLIAADGAGVKIYSNDESQDVLQDVTVSLNKIDLKRLVSSLAFMPRMEGLFSGDVRIVQDKEQLTLSGDVDINDFIYEHSDMGNIGAEFVYIPQDNKTHFVSGQLTKDENEVATITGTYRDSKDGDLDMTLSLMKFPLQMVNGFIPDQLLGFKGYGDGDLAVKGTLKKPKVDGEIYLDSSYIVSIPYGVQMRFADDPVRIENSKLLLENFELYGYNENPLNIYGNVDFSDLDNMSLHLRMKAMNLQLINSKEMPNSIAYGKAFVNFIGVMTGPVSALRMRGRAELLASTDMTYVIKDSPLSNDNQLEGLVEFVDLSDTTKTVVVRPKPTGLNMNMSIDINNGARVLCYLNSDHSNYVDLTGGGDLQMAYNNTDDLTLKGRYTVNSGEMKYSLPIIPLKTFTISDGSYVEFAGDPMNPTLSISATERTNAVVNSDGGTSRSVAFDCGVKLSKTLKDMGLEFIVSAPEDGTVQSELSSMSVEQRGKIAVTLLTTGMYLTDGNTSNFSMNSALNTFLQSEINKVTGNALRSVDLSFGMENARSSTGQDYTNYSFKFAKRFWDNRLNVIVGGKIATANDPQYTNNSFFDNVTFEYRLDKTSNKNLKLFYQKNYYDWLEGNLTRYGLGFVWRRKLQYFKDIFKFKNVDYNQPPIRRDSVSTSIRNDSITPKKDE